MQARQAAAVCHSRPLGPVVHYACPAYIHADAVCGVPVGDINAKWRMQVTARGPSAFSSSKCRRRYERTGKCRIVHLSRMHP